ncbi:hypothetical protein SAMD00019534_010270 [Acytostelium subglobosum LB1]|uniref:hypothetical protein n=1 Tax=Acytostelium subglobosum LB1 TaxID=1410327 RepID=UPI000644C77F|nr:hypothetical protein SAMD00019534_010270 [Acytostelium subglobosum LB1]GAM17852.1 hypothetical protein SAMD00019534_010270 [Acytostelium subglobosum LB1]|eukprot:XP_012758448.1 hypothetical protein SAMD00019534_010270 [Acytostelium subglobosum LB1]
MNGGGRQATNATASKIPLPPSLKAPSSRTQTQVTITPTSLSSSMGPSSSSSSSSSSTTTQTPHSAPLLSVHDHGATLTTKRRSSSLTNSIGPSPSAAGATGSTSKLPRRLSMNASPLALGASPSTPPHSPRAPSPAGIKQTHPQPSSRAPSPCVFDGTSSRDDSVVKVICRFRPETFDEGLLDSAPDKRIVFSNDGASVTVNNGAKTLSFKFSRVLQPMISQERVYQLVGLPLVEDVVNGYNAAIIAYGCTGTGKTYTMVGQLKSDLIQHDTLQDMEDSISGGGEGVVAPPIAPDEHWGLIPRTMRQLFQRISESSRQYKFQLKVSYIEVIQEKVRDLLADNKADLELRLVDQGFSVPDAVQLEITHIEQVTKLIESASARKAESRGHILFLVSVNREDVETKDIVNSLLYMVDLSGSESVSTTRATGQRLDDAKSINKSLYALGGVIEDIAKRSKHVRYRDSKLTQLLQNCLGGNSKTCLIVNCSVSGHDSVLRDTISSLYYGERAQSVRNQPSVNNELPAPQLKSLIQTMKSEQGILKQVVEEAGGSEAINPGFLSNYMLRLQNELEECRKNETKLQEQVTSLEQESHNVNKQLSESKALIESKQEALARFESERSEMARKVAGLSGEVTRGNNRIDELEKLTQAFDELKKSCLAQESLNNEKYTKESENRKTKWKNRCQQLQTQFNQLNEQSTNQRKQQDDLWRDMHGKLEKELAERNHNIEDNLKKEITGLKSQNKAQDDIITNLSNRLQGLIKQSEDIQKQQTQLKQQQQTTDQHVHNSQLTTTNQHQDDQEQLAALTNKLRHIEGIIDRLKDDKASSSSTMPIILPTPEPLPLTQQQQPQQQQHAQAILKQLQQQQLQQQKNTPSLLQNFLVLLLALLTAYVLLVNFNRITSDQRYYTLRS